MLCVRIWLRIMTKAMFRCLKTTLIIKLNIMSNENIANVSHCGLTEIEYTERERLLEIQRDHQRWFTKEEFDRLKELSNKMFKNAGSPHCS